MEEAIADMVLAQLGIENLQPASHASLLSVPLLDDSEARKLVEACEPHLMELCGIPAADCSSNFEFSSSVVANLWGGLGAVYELMIEHPGQQAVSIMVKRVDLCKGGNSPGDERRRESYHCEAAFYTKGHAKRLAAVGCVVPTPFYVDIVDDRWLRICMSKLCGQQVRMGLEETLGVVRMLARFHAAYWGGRADEAVRTGLQPQGCFWHFDCQLHEYAKMPKDGWQGRLRLAARGIDERLKRDKMQTICHGDAKGENIMFDIESPCKESLSPMFCDFQYCGKAPPTKDLAYVLTCATNVPHEEEHILLAYHQELSELLSKEGDSCPKLDEVSDSLSLSFCDLGRWMSGWGWWGNPIDDKIISVLDKLDGGSVLGSEADYTDAVMRAFPL